MGIECGLLAQKGWTASSDVFGKGGFFDTFLQGNAKPELLVQDFGAPFRMVEPGVGFKKHPSNYFTHRPIDAALALRARHRLDPGAIARVDIRFPRFDYVNRPQPKTGLDGKFSVQYTTVVALLDGEITVDSFDDARRFAPDAVGLLERTTLHFDDAIARDFDRMHCIVAVTLQDGRVLEEKVEKLSGWVGSPLSAEQRLRKFHGCARRVLDADAAARVVQLVERLDSLEDVRGLMDIVRGNG
jgi:aconitate decarboxylase